MPEPRRSNRSCFGDVRTVAIAAAVGGVAIYLGLLFLGWLP